VVQVNEKIRGFQVGFFFAHITMSWLTANIACMVPICHHCFQAMISELWYVEEYDVLALALNGKMKVRRLHLDCNHQGN